MRGLALLLGLAALLVALLTALDTPDDTAPQGEIVLRYTD